MVKELDCQKQITGDSGVNVKRLARARNWCQDRAVGEQRSFEDIQRCCGNASETCDHSEELIYMSHTSKSSTLKLV